MKSTRRVLEETVVDEARTVALQWQRGELSADHMRALCGRLDALDAHIGAITDRAGAFVPGSQTSETAAVLGRLTVGSVRRRIVDEIRSIGLYSSNVIGLTDDELERRLHRPHTTVSSARNWLCNEGWLRDSHHTRVTSSGREATVWELTDAAKAQVSSPEWVERSKA